MTGIILAGGESRRMGRDKAFLDLAGKPLIAHILGLFRELFDRTIIVTRQPERFRSLPAEVVPDALDAPGPLTGIYTGLLHSPDDLNFVAACDMPFLQAGLIRFMQSVAQGRDAVVPLVGGMPEPLHAMYRRGILPVVEASLGSGERRISPLFERIAVRYLTPAEIRRHDPEQRSFRNLNTPEEYKEAACSV
jgi:molybdopterin-guanine dinucleotide biosynthesis protein A